MKVVLLVIACAAAGLVAAEDDSLQYVDEMLSDDDGVENRVVERMRAGVQREVDRLEELAGKREEVLTKFADKLKEVRSKIDAASSVKELRILHIQVRNLRIQIAKSLGEKKSRYAMYDTELHNVFLRIKKFLATKEGLDMVRGFSNRLDTSRHPVIFLVKAFIESTSDRVLVELLQETSKGLDGDGGPIVDIHADFDRAAAFLRSQEGLDTIKAHFKALNTNHQIVLRLKTLINGADDQTIRDIINAFLPLIDEYYYAPQVGEKLRTLFKEIRTVLITDEGIKAVRDYARAIEPTHPILFLVKAFIQGASDQILLEILDEVFAGVQYQSASEKLEVLFHEVKEILDTNEGFQALKTYLLSITSTHPIVSRLNGFIKTTNDDALREILDALFGLL